LLLAGDGVTSTRIAGRVRADRGLTRNTKPAGADALVWSHDGQEGRGLCIDGAAGLGRARLKPHLAHSVKLSNDPRFEEKLIDVWDRHWLTSWARTERDVCRVGRFTRHTGPWL